MVRGRRARVTDTASNAVLASAVNGSHLVDDQFCASPKRKDCKVDEVTKNIKVIKANGTTTKLVNSESKPPYEIFGAKTRSQTIKNFFKTTVGHSSCNGINSVYMNGKISQTDNTNRRSTSIDITEDTCDEVFEYTGVKENGMNHSIEPNEDATSNIFLQEPVLSLNVDKSPNQPSSIKINKILEVDPIFSSNGYHNNLNGHFNKAVRLSSSPKSEVDATNILLNHDSNSCDSGVVIDNKLELSPSRRRKPTTPHRILCPSPAKHASIEKSPSASLVSYSLINGIASPGYLNAVQKKNPKPRRRLNPNHSENTSSIKSPQLVGGVILTDDTLKKSNSSTNNVSQKIVLNSATNPTAEQNTNNNYKKRTNSQNQQRQSKSHISSGSNKELTDFFPVRRSVRKTKRAVQEEMMRSIEKAITEGREDGLKVEHFEGKGRGVVAERLFNRGEFVVEYIGDLITIAEANQREKRYSLDENAGCYMYYFKHRNQQYCIDATAETGKFGRLVNHSRTGNLITKIVVVKNRPHLVLIAKDDIQPGEELTYDYGDRSKEALLHHPWLAL